MSSTRSVDAGPGIDVGSRDRELEDVSATGEHDTLDYPDPINHGFGMELVLEDLATGGPTTYRRLYDGWRDAVADPANEPHVLVRDVHSRFDWLDEDYPAHLVLGSSKWKAGQDAVDGDLVGQRYEYTVQVMRYDEETGTLAANVDGSLRAPVSYQAWVQPQDETLVLPSGDTLVCYYGEGTKIRPQTTYASPRESIARTAEVMNAVLDALDAPRPEWETLNRESLRVWKSEVYHRIPEEYMSVLAQRLRDARTLIEFGGGSDVAGDGTFRRGQHVREKVVSDMFDRLGFLGFAARDGFNLGLKVYRIGGNPADERLKHPKLEAFFAGTGRDTKLPHVDEWCALQATLRQLASAFAIRCGVSWTDLVGDDYYDPDERDMVDVVVPKGWRQAMREVNQERMRRILKITYESLSKARWDVLWVVSSFEGATYEQLQDATGYSYDYVREICHELEELNVLHRTTWPRVVVFHNEELRLNARELLQDVHPDRGFDDIRADAEERRERRLERQQESASSGSEPDAAAAGSESGQPSPSDERPGARQSDGEIWRLFSDLCLTSEQLGTALARERIAPEHVQIRTDPYGHLVGPPPN